MDKSHTDNSFNKSTTLSPIALFVYNRLWHTKQTIEALQKNELASESELFVFSDGPKDEQAEPKVKEVRKYIKTIDGLKKLTVIEREKNHGLAVNIIDGVTKIVNEYGKVIVLEDDLATSPYFLRFMNDALEFYNDEEKVISIHGYIYPVKAQLPEMFFLRGADCWGWATWKRGWNLFEHNGEKLYDEIKAKKLEKEFNFDGSFNFMQISKDYIDNKNDSWAIRWYASAFIKNKLTLYPGVSLVNNIGHDGSGIHSVPDERLSVRLSDRPLKIGNILIQENSDAKKIIIDYFNSLKIPIYLRIFKKINGLFKNYRG